MGIVQYFLTFCAPSDYLLINNVIARLIDDENNGLLHG